MLSFPAFFLSTGLSIHTFHGNFFVRSTDLVSLPNVSPDSGFSMQIDIEDSLTDSNIAVFQSALLYTSTKGNVASNKPVAVVPSLCTPGSTSAALSVLLEKRLFWEEARTHFLSEPICTLNHSLYFMS